MHSLAAAHRFRDALVLGEAAASEDLLSADVRARSPIHFAPYSGRATTWRLLAAMDQALGAMTLGAPLAGSPCAVIPFEAEALGCQLQGLHLLDPDADHRVSTLALFLRPASGLDAARRAILDALGAASDQ